MGCDCVQISLDGATPAVHDAIRGPASFAASVRAMEVQASILDAAADELERRQRGQ